MKSDNLQKAQNYLRHAEYIEGLLTGDNQLGSRAIQTTSDMSGYFDRRVIQITGLSTRSAEALIVEIQPLVNAALRADAKDARELATQIIMDGFELRLKEEDDA